MKYVSTRGSAPSLNFDDVVLAGLASDGGLYVPESVPQFSPAEITKLARLDYSALALEIIHPFVGGTLTRDELKKLIDDAYRTFRHSAIAPLKQLAPNDFLLELFHGPTLAFKDFALQFLGRLLDRILTKRDERTVIVGATSGDTGSAAIAGCRGRDRMQIFILHPHNRVSDVQRRQMTTIDDANVHNIALQGNFDDCQDIVKALFGDESFRKTHRLSAVNSINWARILAQVVYYFYAGLALGAPARPLCFSVPTGNFGDIYAGYIAQKMGLPISQLIIATNRNDILARTLESGTYGMTQVTPSLSPSMDIQVSSNFERLLFDLYNRDGRTIAEMMQRFRNDGAIALSPAAHQALRKCFASHAVDDEMTKRTISGLHTRTGEILDPHSAVGVCAGRVCHKPGEIPLITLATAHPAKFPDAVKAACGIHPALPPHMQNLFDLPERFDVLPNGLAEVKTYITGHVKA